MLGALRFRVCRGHASKALPLLLWSNHNLVWTVSPGSPGAHIFEGIRVHADLRLRIVRGVEPGEWCTPVMITVISRGYGQDTAYAARIRPGYGGFTAARIRSGHGVCAPNEKRAVDTKGFPVDLAFFRGPPYPNQYSKVLCFLLEFQAPRTLDAD